MIKVAMMVLIVVARMPLYGRAHTVKLSQRCYYEAKTLAAPPDLADVERTIQSLVDSGAAPSISVVVIRQGTALWDKAYGWADKENRVPATTDTIYAVGSVSKSLTGTAVYALVAAGLIDIGQPASRYLKSIKLQTYAGEPTVAQLIAMRGGIPHGWEYAEAPNLPRDEWKRHAIVAFTPGTDFLYSNISYGVLGEIVSDTTGKSLDNALTRLVFAPLGMTHTALHPSKVQRPFLAVGYSRRGRLPGYPIAPEGGAGFSSSARDLARFGMLHAGVNECSLRSVSAEALRDLHRSADYAYGWGRLEAPNGRKAFLSNGEVQGGRASIMVVPEDKTVIVIAQNTHSGSPNPDDLTVAIAEKLMPGFSAGFQAQVEEFQAKQKVLPRESLSGKWTGEVVVDGHNLPMFLEFSQGTATLRIADGETQAVKNLKFTNEGLEGEIAGTLPTSWTGGRKHSLSFHLIPKEKFMQGLVFVQTIDDKPGIGLPHYLKFELAK